MTRLLIVMQNVLEEKKKDTCQNSLEFFLGTKKLRAHVQERSDLAVAPRSYYLHMSDQPVSLTSLPNSVFGTWGERY